jgi:hypothetical protein
VTYLRANGTVVISDCPACPGAPTATGAFALSGDATGTAGEGDYIAELKRQVNRFIGPTVAPGVAVSAGPKIPISTSLEIVPGDGGTALGAIVQAIVAMRAVGGAYANLPEQQRDILINAPQLMAPAYLRAHLSDVLTLVTNYADSKGLPPAESGGIIESISGWSTTKKVVVGAVAAGVVFGVLTKKRGRR